MVMSEVLHELLMRHLRVLISGNCICLSNRIVFKSLLLVYSFAIFYFDIVQFANCAMFILRSFS